MRTSEAVSGTVAARIISASALSLPVWGHASSVTVHVLTSDGVMWLMRLGTGAESW